jgi:hypothetical protein
MAIKKRHRYSSSMKTIKPGVIALLLWLLFVASNAFAEFKPTYPLKAYPPDQPTIVTGGFGGVADSHGEQGVGTATKPK